MDITKKTIAKIKSALRKVWRNSGERKAALAKAKLGKKKLYKCNRCKKAFDRNSISVDHINPVIAVDDGFIDWNTYIIRLFTNALQVLCDGCHKKKTSKENKRRK